VNMATARRRNPGLIMVTNPPAGAPGVPVSERAALQQLQRLVNDLYVAGSGGDRDSAELFRHQAANLVAALLAQLARGVHANPRRRGNPEILGGQKMSNHVQAIVYDHLTKGPRVHGFGNAEPDLKERGPSLTMTGLRDFTDVEMFALRDGSLRIRHKHGEPLWWDDGRRT
jgi:hypothetical protein